MKPPPPRLPAAGHKDLAATLRSIVDDGVAGFYQSGVGAAIVAVSAFKTCLHIDFSVQGHYVRA